MNVPGYCTGCRRPKRVRVTHPTPRGLDYGLCPACDAKADAGHVHHWVPRNGVQTCACGMTLAEWQRANPEEAR